MSDDDTRARVNLTHEADRPSEDDDALYYDLLELVDASEDTADELAWVKGAAIAKIEARYGESRRQLFATEARIARSTAYEYAQMFRFGYDILFDEQSAAWTFDQAKESAMIRDVARKVYLQTKQRYPSLRRTHYRYGMRIGRKLGVDAARAYLDDCQGRALSIEAAGIEAAKLAGKPVPPRPVAEFEAEFYDMESFMRGCDAQVTMGVKADTDLPLRSGEHYIFRVYALESDDR